MGNAKRSVIRFVPPAENFPGVGAFGADKFKIYFPVHANDIVGVKCNGKVKTTSDACVERIAAKAYDVVPHQV